MKTGDGSTEDAGRATRNEENVIRLPRDWLGPPEELVPIGPAARARAAQLEGYDSPPPTADAFWSEDSAALHDAVQAPANDARVGVSSAAALVPPPLSGQSRLRLPLSGWTGIRRMRLRWLVLAVPAAALLVLAAIGFGEPAGTGAPASHHDGTVGVSQAAESPAMKASMAFAVASIAKHAATSAQRHARRAAVMRSRARARARTRTTSPQNHRRTSPTPTHQSSAVPAQTVAAASTPVRAVTVTSAPSPQTTSASTAGSDTSAVRTATPVSGTASEPSSGGSSSASSASSAPPAGPTGIGSMSGGCTVKCS